MRASWSENDYINRLILLGFTPSENGGAYTELNNHQLGMFASVTFDVALMSRQACGWLNTSKPHLTPAPWAWREINRLERIMNIG